jgi:hypothetical protein
MRGAMTTPIQLPDLSLLNDLRDQVSANAKAKGFGGPPKGVSEEVWRSPDLAIVRAAIFTSNQHGESSEFWEAARKGNLDAPCDKADAMVAKGLPPLTCAEEEIADELIRVLDKSSEFKIDVAKAVAVKMAYNSGRPFQHGGKLA